MALPKKEQREARTEAPTVRMSPTLKRRVKAAAKRQGYAYYTEFMHDAIEGAVVESEVAEKGVARKGRGRKTA